MAGILGFAGYILFAGHILCPAESQLLDSVMRACAILNLEQI